MKPHRQSQYKLNSTRNVAAQISAQNRSTQTNYIYNKQDIGKRLIHTQAKTICIRTLHIYTLYNDPNLDNLNLIHKQSTDLSKNYNPSSRISHITLKSNKNIILKLPSKSCNKHIS